MNGVEGEGRGDRLEHRQSGPNAQTAIGSRMS